MCESVLFKYAGNQQSSEDFLVWTRFQHDTMDPPSAGPERSCTTIITRASVVTPVPHQFHYLPIKTALILLHSFQSILTFAPQHLSDLLHISIPCLSLHSVSTVNLTSPLPVCSPQPSRHSDSCLCAHTLPTHTYTLTHTFKKCNPS